MQAQGDVPMEMVDPDEEKVDSGEEKVDSGEEKEDSDEEMDSDEDDGIKLEEHFGTPPGYDLHKLLEEDEEYVAYRNRRRWKPEGVNSYIRSNIYLIFKIFYSEIKISQTHENTAVKISFSLSILIVYGLKFFEQLITFLSEKENRKFLYSQPSPKQLIQLEDPRRGDTNEDRGTKSRIRLLLEQEFKGAEDDLKTCSIDELGDYSNRTNEFRTKVMDPIRRGGETTISDNLISFLNNGVAYLKTAWKGRSGVYSTFLADNNKAKLDTSEWNASPISEAKKELYPGMLTEILRRFKGNFSYLTEVIFELYLIYNILSPEIRFKFIKSLEVTPSAHQERVSELKRLHELQETLKQQLGELKNKDDNHLLKDLALTEHKIKQLQSVNMTYRDTLPVYFGIPTDLYEYTMGLPGIKENRSLVEAELRKYRDENEEEPDEMEADVPLEGDTHFKDDRLKFYRSIVKEYTGESDLYWRKKWAAALRGRIKKEQSRAKVRGTARKGPKWVKSKTKSSWVGAGYRKKKKKPIRTEKRKKPSKKETKAQRERRLRKRKESRRKERQKKEKKSKKKNRTNRNKRKDRTIRIGDSVEIHYN